MPKHANRARQHWVKGWLIGCEQLGKGFLISSEQLGKGFLISSEQLGKGFLISSEQLGKGFLISSEQKQSTTSKIKVNHIHTSQQYNIPQTINEVNISHCTSNLTINEVNILHCSGFEHYQHAEQSLCSYSSTDSLIACVK